MMMMEIENIISDSTFSMLKGKVDSRILQNLKLMGFEKPTRIQAETVPYALLEKDIIGTAKTGSGKTLAFLIPAVEKLINLGFSRKHACCRLAKSGKTMSIVGPKIYNAIPSEIKEIQSDAMFFTKVKKWLTAKAFYNIDEFYCTGCIILSPTRELALQIFQVLKKLLVDINLTYSLIVGGEKKTKDLLALEKGVNIVVSTPGRLFDHLQNTKCFNVKNLKCLVVDEADKLLEAGFEKHITGIVQLLPKNRQTLLFSATLDSNVKNLARLALREDPVVISTSDHTQSTVTGLQQGYYLCPVEQRLSWLYKMLRKSKKLKVMVFFSSCKSVDFHYEFFRNHCKASILSIHGRQSQARRKEAYQKFIEAKHGALFCTDVAARGLDVPSVDWIVQYDPPTDPKEYIHRVGRTARGLNNTGNAVILLRPQEEAFIHFLKSEKVFLDKYSFEEPSDDIQKMLEDLIIKNGVMKLLARKAYLSFLRCYKAHPLKEIFNINNLDINLAAKAFGFLETPHNDFHFTVNKPKKRPKNTKQNVSTNAIKT